MLYFVRILVYFYAPILFGTFRINPERSEFLYLASLILGVDATYKATQRAFDG